MILDFEKPQKLRSTEEHNKINSSDCGVPGTFVPNMSDEDAAKWRAKHISGKDERVEIKKSFGGASTVIVIYKNINEGTKENWWRDKHGNVRISCNNKLNMTFDEYKEFLQAIEEAKEILNIKEI